MILLSFCAQVGLIKQNWTIIWTSDTIQMCFLVIQNDTTEPLTARDEWEQGWRSGWPGFDSRSRRQMWVEFVVGSRPCSGGFFSGYSSFPLSSKPTFLNSNSIWKVSQISAVRAKYIWHFNKVIHLFIYFFGTIFWAQPVGSQGYC